MKTQIVKKESSELINITKRLESLNLSSNEKQEYDLLDYDKTSSEEEILGSSFNIPYKNKFIPGNKIHKELAYKEEVFKMNFYKEKELDLYSYYTSGREKIVHDVQNNHKINKQKLKKAFKEDLNDFTYKKVTSGLYDIKDELAQKHIDYKNSVLKEFEFVVNEQKKIAIYNKYPNFATAKLSYIKDDKIYSKNITLEHEEEMIKSSNFALDHSERRIFRYIEKEILKEKYQTSDTIVLDIHTKLNTCNSCFEEAKNILDRNKSLMVRISFDDEYLNTYNLQKQSIALIQKHIEYVEKWSPEWKWEEGSVIGSGSALLKEFAPSFSRANESTLIEFIARSYVEELIESTLKIIGDIEHYDTL